MSPRTIGGKFASAGVVLLGFAKVTFATVVSCSIANPGTAIGTLGTGSPSSGCAEIDKSFTNFTVTPGSGSPTASDVNVFATGANPVGNTISPVTLDLDTSGSVNQWFSGPAISDTVNFEVTANTGGSFSGGTYPTPATSGAFWAVNQIVLTPSITITGASSQNTANITLTFCLGATTTTGCPASNSGQIVAVASGPSPTIAYTCTFSGCVSSTSNTVNLGGSFTQIAISESVSLASANTSGQSVAVNNIADQFGEFASGATASTIPEPSAGVMAGAGLVAIAFLRRWRQRA